MIAHTEVLAPTEADFHQLLAELTFDGAPVTPEVMLARVTKTIGKGKDTPRLVFWYFLLWRDHNQLLRDFIASPALFRLEEAKNSESEEGLRMRKELRSLVEKLLLPSKNEIKKKKAAEAAAGTKGPAAGTSKSTTSSASRKAIVRERLRAMGVGAAPPSAGPSEQSTSGASAQGKGAKRKASKTPTKPDDDAKKSKPTEVDDGNASPSKVAADMRELETEDAEEEVENLMEVSGPHASGEQAKRPYSEVAKVSLRPDQNPFTLEVTRYVLKGGKKEFSSITKQEWEEGIYYRISQFLSKEFRKNVLKTAKGELGEPYKVLNNFVKDGCGIIVPKDARTCQWLSQEIIPLITFKQARLCCRLKPKKVNLDHSKTTPMVRCTITLPTGWRTNGKDDF